MKILNSLILSTITAGLLIGCGGGGSDGSSSSSITSSTGTLIDNTVSGVKYINGSDTGFTDTDGKFPYTSGLVEFYLGGIKIGELNSMTSDNKVFLQDLIGLERTNTTDSKLLKIANLLQSLDSDPLTDEIEILKSDFDKFESSTQSIDALDVNTVLTNNGFTPLSDEDVKTHIENSLKQFGEISDTTEPELISSSIVNGTFGVSIKQSIVLTFSETIPKEYITNEYFILTNDLNSSNVDIKIEAKNKVITITPRSDLDYSQSYEFVISSKLKDFAGNTLSNDGGNTDILIEFLVQDEPDTIAPVFTSQSSISVDENQTSALTVTATDNSSIIYGLSGLDATSFRINSITGEISFIISPDYETKNLYSIDAIATDSSNNQSTQNITLHINDVNEIIPDTTAPTLSSTNKTFRTIVGTSLAYESVTATDNNDNITVSSHEIVDFNTAGIYEIEYSATDSSSNKSSIIHTYEVYDIVNSDITGKTWLDRNIGAKEVCNDISNIYNCIGDYFQWGRSSDGHEKTSSPISSSYSGPLATTLYNLDNTFIRSDSDWIIGGVDSDGSLRSDFWSQTDGTSVCPSGFRIPTNEELRFELVTEDIRINTSSIYSMVLGKTDVFNSFLKLPSGGMRWRQSGTVLQFGHYGYYWTNKGMLYFSDDLISSMSKATDYARGMNIRCIKDDAIVYEPNDYSSILPMEEVGSSKSISSATINTTTTVTLAAGSQLYFKVSNILNRNFIVNKFEIKSYYNNVETIRSSTSDLALLNNGILEPYESIQLGYTLNNNETANYWTGIYTLVDSYTNETITRSFIWDGTNY
ncbi:MULTISPECIES: Ig-like domain-containing protein [Arcobacteraceae]|uniref:Cadherin domain-containing protein n=1 Tax=Poseidonibacter parvus TaxID=1850254 RepID=A0A1P8KN11_9BACT|nr:MULTISPECIES: Ig-like domain-containing protein [Arcobacteraceae]APW65941.1 hypothetical protein LPB137_08760 [Poseidonibacter parvus]